MFLTALLFLKSLSKNFLSLWLRTFIQFQVFQCNLCSKVYTLKSSSKRFLIGQEMNVARDYVGNNTKNIGLRLGNFLDIIVIGLWVMLEKIFSQGTSKGLRRRVLIDRSWICCTLAETFGIIRLTIQRRSSLVVSTCCISQDGPLGHIQQIL